MKRFLFEYPVLGTHGTQVFYVDAETADDALHLLEGGGGAIYSEEIEVTDIGEPELCGETTLDDFGEFGEETGS